MSGGRDNVSEFPKRTVQGNGNGGNIGERLRVLEIEVAKITAKIDHVATREDVLNLKLWILGGVIGSIALASGLVIAIIRIFFS